MKKEPNDVIVMPSKAIGSRVIIGSVGVFVVVPDVGWKEHETRYALNNAKHPIRQSIQPLGFPHT
jgi:hypothetical protein